jgi:prophage maintenance system killer protein
VRACSSDLAARRDYAIAQRESLSQNHPFVDGNKRVAASAGQRLRTASG